MAFRLIQQGDLPQIVAIYNQVIEQRTVTADLQPVTVASRQAWFDAHLHNPKYPMWVYELDGRIVAWCSYSQFYTRSAYDCTTEISFYLDKAVHGKGLGKQTVQFLIEQMPHYNMTNLLGFVFGNNQPSLGLLRRCGFKDYGLLPSIADMQDHHENLVILGYKATD